MAARRMFVVLLRHTLGDLGVTYALHLFKKIPTIFFVYNFAQCWPIFTFFHLWNLSHSHGFYQKFIFKLNIGNFNM